MLNTFRNHLALTILLLVGGVRVKDWKRLNFYFLEICLSALPIEGLLILLGCTYTVALRDSDDLLDSRL